MAVIKPPHLSRGRIDTIFDVHEASEKELREHLKLMEFYSSHFKNLAFMLTENFKECEEIGIAIEKLREALLFINKAISNNGRV